MLGRKSNVNCLDWVQTHSTLANTVFVKVNYTYEQSAIDCTFNTVANSAVCMYSGTAPWCSLPPVLAACPAARYVDDGWPHPGRPRSGVLLVRVVRTHPVSRPGPAAQRPVRVARRRRSAVPRAPQRRARHPMRERRPRRPSVLRRTIRAATSHAAFLSPHPYDQCVR